MEGIIAKWYARNAERDLEDYRRSARLVADRAPAGARVLELAPGPGDLSLELAKLGPFVITGLDISRTFVQIARDKAGRAGAAVDFRHGDASDMPFSAESFDVIVCRAAFKNFSRPVRALDEMHRVLALGGCGLVIDLRPDAPRAAIHDYVDGMGLGPVSSAMTKWMLSGFLRRRARSAGQLRELVAQIGRAHV